MGYENDFVDESPTKIDIDGRVFLYKPTTGGDENSWLNDVMVLNPTTKTSSVDWSMYNRKKLANISAVPYDAVIIKKILNVEKEWKDLTTDQRYNLLSKLKPGLFDKIINAMKKIDEPDTASAKN